MNKTGPVSDMSCKVNTTDEVSVIDEKKTAGAPASAVIIKNCFGFMPCSPFHKVIPDFSCEFTDAPSFREQSKNQRTRVQAVWITAPSFRKPSKKPAHTVCRRYGSLLLPQAGDKIHQRAPGVNGIEISVVIAPF